VTTEDVHLPGDSPAEVEAETLADLRAGLGRRLLLLKALEKRVNYELGEAKRQLRLAGFRPGNTERPPLSDGRPAGAIAYSVGTLGATVTDPEAFAKWAGKHYPTATRLEVVVAEWFTAQVIAGSEAAGVPIGPGGEVGEDAPPGITVKQRAGSISARPDPKRSDALWADIRILTTELKAGIDD
jgi:hypothetical protein